MSRVGARALFPAPSVRTSLDAEKLRLISHRLNRERSSSVLLGSLRPPLGSKRGSRRLATSDLRWSRGMACDEGGECYYAIQTDHCYDHEHLQRVRPTTDIPSPPQLHYHHPTSPRTCHE